MKSLGHRIRELREQGEISLRELARKLNVSAAFISDVERGRRYPSDDLLVDIAKQLKIKVDELKASDTRAPLEDLKRAAEDDPSYGIALRTILDSRMTGEELIKLIEREHKKNNK